MLRFWFKKNFCDGWDNLFHMIVPNLIMLAATVGCVFMCLGINSIEMNDGWKSLLQFAAIFFSCSFVSIFIFAEGENCAKIANFDSPTLKGYFKNILPCVKDGALFGLLIAVLYSVATISIPYYFRMWIPADGSKGTLLGLFLLALVFWALVITFLALQWFIPIRSLMHNSFKKCLKKSFIILFDNTWFTIVVSLNNIILIAVSIFTFGTVPGMSGIILAYTNALRLRLYKYDWYEVNPGMSRQERKDVPWDDLLANDKQTLGPRKFKSFIFPWKE